MVFLDIERKHTRVVMRFHSYREDEQTGTLIVTTPSGESRRVRNVQRFETRRLFGGRKSIYVVRKS